MFGKRPRPAPAERLEVFPTPVLVADLRVFPTMLRQWQASPRRHHLLEEPVVRPRQLAVVVAHPNPVLESPRRPSRSPDYPRSLLVLAEETSLAAVLPVQLETVVPEAVLERTRHLARRLAAVVVAMTPTAKPVHC